jgi:hypothetical protein
VDVHLSVVVVAHAAKHSHTCEATVFMKGGQVGRSVLTNANTTGMAWRGMAYA